MIAKEYQGLAVSLCTIVLLVLAGVMLHLNLEANEAENRKRLEESDDHQYRLILQALEANKQRCGVHVDVDGVIVWANANFQRQIGLAEGDNLSDCVPIQYQKDHHDKMLEAIKQHRAGGERSFVSACRHVIMADGKISLCQVESWTVTNGAMAFMEVLGPDAPAE